MFRVGLQGSSGCLIQIVVVLMGRFPLYMGRGIDRTRFEYGLYLLNMDLQQLMHHQGLEVASLRQTLPNLQILLVALSSPLNATSI